MSLSSVTPNINMGILPTTDVAACPTYPNSRLVDTCYNWLLSEGEMPRSTSMKTSIFGHLFIVSRSATCRSIKKRMVNTLGKRPLTMRPESKVFHRILGNRLFGTSTFFWRIFSNLPSFLATKSHSIERKCGHQDKEMQ